MRLILSEWLTFGKCGKKWKNGHFFWAAMAGLGKYRMGGHGRIGVYRDKDRQLLIRPFLARVQYIDHWDLPPSD